MLLCFFVATAPVQAQLDSEEEMFPLVPTDIRVAYFSLWVAIAFLVALFSVVAFASLRQKASNSLQEPLLESVSILSKSQSSSSNIWLKSPFSHALTQPCTPTPYTLEELKLNEAVLNKEAPLVTL